MELSAFEQQLSKWHEEDEFQRIVDAIEALPTGERTYSLIGRLASALNNLGRYDDALAQLEGVSAEGENDPLWHYRRGYAFYYQDRTDEARKEFARVLELDPADEDAKEFLQWCDRGEPELYTAEELDAVEKFISAQFGGYSNVFHEIASPDIHVDICIVEPTPERNYYTLVTMGMGAHRMNLPEELRDRKLDRAELLICLPPDWKVTDGEEQWYWPLRWLKILARLPGNQDTWLGWGHTVPNGEPFAGNTLLSGILLTNPGAFGSEASCCTLPDGDEVNFYQLIPLYDEEMEYKLQNGAQALLDRMGDRLLEVVNLRRGNVCRFREVGEEDSPTVEWEGKPLCFADREIVEGGCPVGYLFREEAQSEDDSGWRFSAGGGEEEFSLDPEYAAACGVEAVLRQDPEVLPLLDAPVGSAFYRDEDGVFRAEVTAGQGPVFRARVDAFWDWFAENEPQLSDMVERPSEYGAEKIISLLSEGVGLISEELHFNVGGDHEFTFAVEGREPLYYLMPWLVSRMPERYREKWRFFPWMPGSHGVDFAFRIYDVTVQMGQILTAMEYHAEENYFALRFYEKTLCGMEEDRSLNALCLVMENCIGEGIARLYVGEVDRAEAPEEGMFPLTELEQRMREALTAAGREPLTGPDQCYTAYEREADGGTDLRCDVVAGMTCYMGLLEDYYSDEPQNEQMLEELGAKAVFLSFPLEDLQAALQIRHELEDRLESEVLGVRGSGAEVGVVLGGAMGTERAYIDLLLYDEPAFWEKISGLLAQYPLRFTLSAFHRGATPILIH